MKYLVEHSTKYLIVGSFLVALMAAPALAQQSGLTGPQGRHAGPGFAPPKEEPKVKVDEKAYRAAVDRIPNQKVADPWGNVRGPDSTKGQKGSN
jgi:hypothetical protein